MTRYKYVQCMPMQQGTRHVCEQGIVSSFLNVYAQRFRQRDIVINSQLVCGIDSLSLAVGDFSSFNLPVHGRIDLSSSLERAFPKNSLKPRMCEK